MSLDIGALRDLVRAIAGGFAHERRESSHRATVTRVDPDGKVWVSIPGTDEDTPVRTSFSSVSPGDVVSVEISHGSATITGNVSSPSVGGRQVSEAIAPVESMAIDATDEAHRAYEAAESATESAIEAATAAASAQTSATAAGTAAANAQSSATAANTAAGNAKRAADNALTQLSVVQDVAGTLNWIQEHGSFSHTQDQSIQDGKVYFVYDQTLQDYVPVVNPTAADLASYYELDLSDSQAQYVMAHLSVTERGLWVLPGQLKEYFETTDTRVVEGKQYYICDPVIYPQYDYIPELGPDDYILVDLDDYPSSVNPVEELWFEYGYKGSTGYKVLLTHGGLHIYNRAGEEVTYYGATTRVGSINGYHINITSSGINFHFEYGLAYASINEHRFAISDEYDSAELSPSDLMFSRGGYSSELSPRELRFLDEETSAIGYSSSLLTPTSLEFTDATNSSNTVTSGVYQDHISLVNSATNDSIQLDATDGSIAATGDASIGGDLTVTGDADIDGLLTLGDDMERHADISVQIGQDAVASATKLAAANLFDTDQFKAFYFEVDKNASDALFNSYVLRRKSADGTATIAHGFYLWIDANEKQRVTFPDGAAAAWREGMGGLRKVAIFTGKSTTAGNVIGTSTDMLKYEFYLVRFSSWNRVCICHRSVSYLHGTGGRDTGSAAYHLAVTMDVNTTTGATTVTGASETLLSSTITRTNLTVTDIYGLC